MIVTIDLEREGRHCRVSEFEEHRLALKASNSQSQQFAPQLA